MKRILIGASMLALSGNAAAIIMNDDGSKTMEYSDYESMNIIQDVIAGVYNETAQDQRRSDRIARKQTKLDTKLVKLATEDLSNKKERRLNRRVSRLQTKIATVLNKMDIMAKLDDSVIHAILGDTGNESVPEPSTIALLSMGLIGLGAARRLRKKAR